MNELHLTHLLSVVFVCLFLSCASDVNECSTNNGNCYGDCTNTTGSYRCNCPSGHGLFEKSGIAGGCAPTCVSATGDWQCFCRTGYTYVSDGAANEGRCVE